MMRMYDDDGEEIEPPVHGCAHIKPATCDECEHYTNWHEIDGVYFAWCNKSDRGYDNWDADPPEWCGY